MDTPEWDGADKGFIIICAEVGRVLLVKPLPGLLLVFGGCPVRTQLVELELIIFLKDSNDEKTT
ncbi:hypothetical protein [Undibacterium sp. TC9W]|uniref:hypothetical protein n=1 Tax=Undibacterium sp. TC9W TaxID=3413053 RepID=UPI003BF176F6